MRGCIYEPKGRALEYAPLAASLYKGCSHGCVYCYVPKAIRMDRELFTMPAPRWEAFENFKRQAKYRAGDARPILMSFSTDPYQPIDVKYRLTRKALEIMSERNLVPAILTKGGTRAERDFDLLQSMPGAWFGQTFTFFQDSTHWKWEPGTADYVDRGIALALARFKNIKTWVSIEPVYAPNEILLALWHISGLADHFKVGKLNYHPRADGIDWKNFRERAEAILDRQGFTRIHEPGVFEPGTYYLKKDLVEASGGEVTPSDIPQKEQS